MSNSSNTNKNAFIANHTIQIEGHPPMKVDPFTKMVLTDGDDWLALANTPTMNKYLKKMAGKSPTKNAAIQEAYDFLELPNPINENDSDDYLRHCA